jgi:PAS domain S-box-containing protein
VKGTNPAINSEFSAEFYRLLLDNALDIVTVLEPDGTILYANPAVTKVLGYDVQDRPGKKIFEFIHPKDISRVQDVLATTTNTQFATGSVEFRYRHQDGSWRDLETVGVNLCENPAVRGIILNSRDMTERKRAERALRKSETALRRSHAELGRMTARLLKVEEGEHRRLARELHDDFSQKVGLMCFELDSLAKNVPAHRDQVAVQLKSLEARLAQLSDDLHSIAHQLHPSILDDLGLLPALRSYCTDFSKRHGIAVTFHHRDVSGEIPNETSICVYRIVQEALTNVARHSNAKAAQVALVTTDKMMRLTIHDAGVGFHPKLCKRGIGLVSIEERVRLMGGSVSVESQPGDGTKIEAEIPVSKEAK